MNKGAFCGWVKEGKPVVTFIQDTTIIDLIEHCRAEGVGGGIPVDWCKGGPGATALAGLILWFSTCDEGVACDLAEMFASEVTSKFSPVWELHRVCVWEWVRDHQVYRHFMRGQWPSNCPSCG